MSLIYLATQSSIGGFKKLVVLKTILPDIGGEEDFVRMFLEEARTTAAFNHPNIAQVFELDVDAGELFMAMEFVQGCTLVEMARACRAAKEAIPVGLTLQAVRDTALALHYAHTFTDARGRRQIVIHRDVAEKNIMVTYEGVTKLLDFGIAKALGRSSRTSVGMVKGTSGYMSPEQIRGEPLDPRSDIFSLGVVMHECLTGLRLFHGKNAEEGMLAALNATIAPPSRTVAGVTPDIDAVVMRALQRNRDERFSTALEFARAIEKAAPGLIWHPEQTGELVSRHFAQRRQETRRVLEATNFGSETTGEIRIDSLMARVKASSTSGLTPVEPDRAPAPVPPPAPTPPTGLPNSLRSPQASPTPTPSSPSGQRRPSQLPTPTPSSPSGQRRPSQLPTPTPSSPSGQDRPAPRPTPPTTSPSLGRLSPIPAPPPAKPRPSKTGQDLSDRDLARPAVVTLNSVLEGDTSEAKTIPAAALPEEIKVLRAKILAERKAASTNDTQPVSKPPPPVEFGTETDPGAPRLPGTSRDPSADTDPSGGRSANQPKTIPGGTVSPLVQPQAPVVANTTTGETHSITKRATSEPWSSDEPEDRTSPNRAFEPPVPRPPMPSRTFIEPPQSAPVSSSAALPDDDDFSETSVQPNQRAFTPVVAMVLGFLFVAAVLAVLYALNLGPFSSGDAQPEELPAGPTPNTVRPAPTADGMTPPDDAR